MIRASGRIPGALFFYAGIKIQPELIQRFFILQKRAYRKRISRRVNEYIMHFFFYFLAMFGSAFFISLKNILTLNYILRCIFC